MAQNEGYFVQAALCPIIGPLGDLNEILDM